jgi:hypothetical protein
MLEERLRQALIDQAKNGSPSSGGLFWRSHGPEAIAFHARELQRVLSLYGSLRRDQPGSDAPGSEGTFDP